jgi:hypothetical protein
MNKSLVIGIVIGAAGLWVLDRFIFKTPGTPSSNHG